MNASFRLERAATRDSHVSAEEMGAIGVCYIFIIDASATHSSSLFPEFSRLVIQMETLTNWFLKYLGASS